jgi:hypothetical protein
MVIKLPRKGVVFGDVEFYYSVGVEIYGEDLEIHVISDE